MLHTGMYRTEKAYSSYGGTQVPLQDVVSLVKHLIDIAKLWFGPRYTNQLYSPPISVTLRIETSGLFKFTFCNNPTQ